MAQLRRNEFDQRVFTVEGTGRFPYDMLRYDNCWPYTSEDAGRLDSVEPEGRGRRRVVLATRWRMAPTDARWESFLWRVVGEGEQRKATA